jgi:hypothetical protein
VRLRSQVPLPPAQSSQAPEPVPSSPATIHLPPLPRREPNRPARSRAALGRQAHAMLTDVNHAVPSPLTRPVEANTNTRRSCRDAAGWHSRTQPRDGRGTIACHAQHRGVSRPRSLWLGAVVVVRRRVGVARGSPNVAVGSRLAKRFAKDAGTPIARAHEAGELLSLGRAVLVAATAQPSLPGLRPRNRKA